MADLLSGLLCNIYGGIPKTNLEYTVQNTNNKYSQGGHIWPCEPGQSLFAAQTGWRRDFFPLPALSRWAINPRRAREQAGNSLNKNIFFLNKDDRTVTCRTSLQTPNMSLSLGAIL